MLIGYQNRDHTKLDWPWEITPFFLLQQNLSRDNVQITLYKELTTTSLKLKYLVEKN